MWRKSSHSIANGDCIEVDDWHVSSYSYGTGDCVEVKKGIEIRDSKNPDGVILRFNQDTWRDFLATLK